MTNTQGEGLGVGVHYVATEAGKPKCYAAVVVEADDPDTRSLKVFHFGQSKIDVARFKVRYGTDLEPGTYHSLGWCH